MQVQHEAPLDMQCADQVCAQILTAPFQSFPNHELVGIRVGAVVYCLYFICLLLIFMQSQYD